jgi:hypothetical protein
MHISEFCQDPPPTSIEHAAKLVHERPQIGDVFLNDLSPGLQVAWRLSILFLFALLFVVRFHA